jgi:hypothetical protein
MSGEIGELRGLSLIPFKETQTIVTLFRREEVVVPIDVIIMDPSSGCEMFVLIILILVL